MNQQELDDFDEDLISRIRHFLVKDVNFRRQDFDPAPYLIKVLKEKQANQQLLYEKQKQLIELENQAQQLIQQSVAEKNQDFFSLISIPKQFGQQLEQLKHGMAKVKKKVKQTKGLLMATQKDIQQVHLNCMLNKLVHKKLKQVDVKLEQYQSASLALKNHLYLDCAMNLPSFSGNSTLQNALKMRTENLKLRFLSQAIQEVRLFLYFTPRLATPVKHSFLDRMEGSQQAFKLQTHMTFYKRYQLFCKANCQEYIASIWQIQALKQRKGKVLTIDGIIQGVMRIGKSNDITDSLSLDCKKSITNIFSVLFYFFAKDIKDNRVTNKKPWLTSPDTEQHILFLESLFSISAALIRKIVIVRHICFEYQLIEVCDRLATERVLEMIRDEILNYVTDVYFYDGEEALDSIEHPLVQMRKYSNFTIWPYFKHRIESCLGILTQQLNLVEKQLFDKNIPDGYHYFKPFSILQKRFNEQFHQQILKDIESIFPQGRGLIPESYDSILASKIYRKQELQFVERYITEDRRTLRQYMNAVSFLISLKAYFEDNKYDPERMKVYSTFILVFFYLKTNSAVFRSLISPSAYAKIIDTRAKDGKVKNKQKYVQSQFSTLAKRKDKSKVDKKFKILEGDSVPLRNAEQLKMVKTEMQMLLFYCQNSLPPSPQSLTNLYTDKLQSQIDKHQPSNYDDNIPAKLVRVWQQLIKPVGEGQGIDSMLAAIYRRFLDLYLTILTSVYLETGLL